MELKLDSGLVLNLPQVGDLFGIDNFKIIAKYAGRAAGKTKKYAADGKFKLREKINAIFFMGDLLDEGKSIDFHALQKEMNDLSETEKKELIVLAVHEYREAFNKEAVVDGNMIINRFLALAQSVTEWITEGAEKKAA